MQAKTLKSEYGDGGGFRKWYIREWKAVITANDPDSRFKAGTT